MSGGYDETDTEKDYEIIDMSTYKKVKEPKLFYQIRRFLIMSLLWRDEF